VVKIKLKSICIRKHARLRCFCAIHSICILAAIMPNRRCYWFAIVLCMGCNAKRQENIRQFPPQPITVDIEEGKRLYSSCIACHGTRGEGNIDMNAPVLANTDSWYLYRQLLNFKRGIRGNSPNDSLGFQMAAMSGTLKDSIEISHVVVYLESLPAVSLPALISGDIQNGKRIYENICGSCHGQSARGNEKLNAPNLNGLDDWYIKRQVLAFKTGMRGSHPKDTFGAQMVPMMALLTRDEAIDDVIAYIRSTVEPETK
jgi:cytochrome c553